MKKYTFVVEITGTDLGTGGDVQRALQRRLDSMEATTISVARVKPKHEVVSLPKGFFKELREFAAKLAREWHGDPSRDVRNDNLIAHEASELFVKHGVEP